MGIWAIMGDRGDHARPPGSLEGWLAHSKAAWLTRRLAGSLEGHLAEHLELQARAHSIVEQVYAKHRVEKVKTSRFPAGVLLGGRGHDPDNESSHPENVAPEFHVIGKARGDGAVGIFGCGVVVEEHAGLGKLLTEERLANDERAHFYQRKKVECVGKVVGKDPDWEAGRVVHNILPPPHDPVREEIPEQHISHNVVELHFCDTDQECHPHQVPLNQVLNGAQEGLGLQRGLGIQEQQEGVQEKIPQGKQVNLNIGRWLWKSLEIEGVEIGPKE